MKSTLFLIAGMMLATYLPRLLPFTLLEGKTLPERLRRFLKLIPYAALGALIFPGILTATPQAPLAGILGGLAALALCVVRGGIILPVLCAVLTAWLVLTL